MSKTEKLIHKIMEDRAISYDEAEGLLLKLGFSLRIKASHHIFSKECHDTISLKRRSQLLPYQMKLLKKVLKDHE